MMSDNQDMLSRDEVQMTLPGKNRPAHHLVYQVFRSVNAGLDWLYPPHCAGCAEPGVRWCAKCQAKTQLVNPPICEICGSRLPGGVICPRCQAQRPAYIALRSWALFQDPLRTALHQLKYYGNLTLGEALARPLITLLGGLDWLLDLVTPVPAGVDRLSQRGYNQAALLAHPLALGCGLDYRPQALVKVRPTRSQVGLSAQERHENVSGAFRGEAKVVKSKRVLVVDDVTTSGATMQVCAQALLDAGAQAVYGMTLAQAVSAHRLQRGKQLVEAGVF